MNKFRLNPNQIVNYSKCKHCGEEVIEDKDYHSGSYDYDSYHYCTCPTSEYVSHYRKTVYDAQKHLDEQQELLDGFMSVEPKRVVDARVEAQVNEVLKKSGYTVEELRSIFKLDK